MQPSALAGLDLLTAADAARLLGVSRQAVHQALQRGRAPAPAVRVPYGPLWSREVVERWADERRRARGAADAR